MFSVCHAPNSATDAKAVLDAVSAAAYPIPTTAAALTRAIDLMACGHKAECACVQRLSLGCPKLDACLGGVILTVWGLCVESKTASVSGSCVCLIERDTCMGPEMLTVCCLCGKS